MALCLDTAHIFLELLKGLLQVVTRFTRLPKGDEGLGVGARTESDS
jgi:hypothetical protein